MPRGGPRGGGRPRNPTPEEKQADDLIVAALCDQDAPDPLWQRRLRSLPVQQALASAATVRIINIKVPVQAGGLLTRAASEDGVSRSAWVRRLIAENLSRRYGVDVADLDTLGSRE